MSVYKLFHATGGFSQFLKSGRTARGLMSALRKAERDLSWIHGITLYMLRYKRHVSDDEKLKIEFAKQFVFLSHDQKPGSVRNLSKVWETYKQAAPYVFALFELFQKARPHLNTMDDFAEFLEGIASKQEYLDRVLGNAAFLADVLGGTKVRNVRLLDFKETNRVEPTSISFSPEEKDVISNLNIHQLTKQDLRSFRPKSISKKRHAANMGNSH